MNELAHGAAMQGGLTRRERLLAIGWLLLVIALIAHQVQFWRASRLDTDVMALLPTSERTATADRVLRQLTDGVSREIVVLVGGSDWARTRAAAQRFSQATSGGSALLKPVDKIAAFDFDAALAFYRPWRDGLLTDAQREALRTTNADTLAQQALTRLYQFSTGPRLTDWASDPLGLWQNWWLSRAAVTRVHERDGLATVTGEGKDWVLLTYRITKPAFSANGSTDYGDLLHAAEAAARQGDDGVRVVTAGIPLHAEAAAAQANWEMNVIGWGSLAAVLLLVWLAFRSLRPIVLVGLSLLIGTAAAISATAIVFDRVHLITLVFGASLVGVAEDFGIHYFVTRQAMPRATPPAVMRFLAPGLALALSTSVVAYLALGIAPFPGLRQMALFSAVGLITAFLTVLFWFPLLDRGNLRPTRLSTWLADSLARWPYARNDRRTWLALGVLMLFIVSGIWQVRVADDIRQLQSSPPALIEAQRTAGQLLGTPSPAQFILVRGATPDEVLAREEAIKAGLADAIRRGDLAGFIAISDWVPSAGRQQADAALADRQEAAIRARVASAVGGSIAPPAPSARAGDAVLTLPAWLANPVSETLRHLWLGREGNGFPSVMLLRGLEHVSAIPGIAASVRQVPGAEWVDRVADISFLLHHYRVLMSWFLLAGAVGVALLLWWRYGRSGWRALVPTLLAAAFSVAVLGWTGVPLQLFSVLALALLLGVGVDYGIFLLEHPGDGVSWTAIVLGAASTLLAFGLLALSSTPALHAFGATMLSGVGAVWVMSPWFRPLPGTSSHQISQEGSQ
ncbi:MMPL family transporter [Cupriavidus metallidurans]|uniref:MMPL family transporter n=1 Tax=Cupriavidus metallidurans TaxID=119219 RepID=UPI001D1318FF|nr:MMPL family transporter [Cupriavidus metallidurans]